ncbi:hypothetical protein R1sor_025170 [Riccia sorocarpa]|uniref:Replication factor A C-terminal domain-containing protein n=1 Tax=Riccia sorocarpa TaxID=122646 RepID=A0ABD3G9D8_9MARC
MFAAQLRRGNYLKISNFTLSSKSRKRFEKGDLKTIIKLNPSSKVAVAHAWNPPARPIFFPKDTVASLRLRMQMRYETGDVAVVCIGDIGENNGTYRINVTDGMADEDTVHVILDGSFRQDYETLHRKFTIGKAACLFFKNLNVNPYEHCFRAERHTIIVPVEQEDIMKQLELIFNKRVGGKVDIKKIRGTLKVQSPSAPPYKVLCKDCTTMDFAIVNNAPFCRLCRRKTEQIRHAVLDCVIYDDCNEVTNITVRGIWIFSVTGENENQLLQMGKKDRIRLLSQVSRIGTFSVNYSELVGIDDIGPPRNPLQVPAVPTIPLIEDVPRQIEHCIATNLEDTGSTTNPTSEDRMEEDHEVTKEERSKESMEEGDNIL